MHTMCIERLLAELSRPEVCEKKVRAPNGVEIILYKADRYFSQHTVAFISHGRYCYLRFRLLERAAWFLCTIVRAEDGEP